MVFPFPLLAQANLGEGLFYAYFFLFVIGLMIELAIIVIASLWIAKRAKVRPVERAVRRVLLGGLIGGLLASGLAAMATFPLINLLASGELWIAGSLVLACGIGACLGASLGVNPNMKALGAAALFSVSLLAIFQIAQTVSYQAYRRPAIKEALERIGSGDVTVLRHLSTYSQDKLAIVDALLKSLEQFPPHKRREAIRALGEIGKGDDHVTAQLWSLVEEHQASRNPEEAAAAIEALGKQGSQAASSVPKLLFVVRDSPSPQVRISSIQALTEIDPVDRKLIPALLHAAEDENSQVRQQAIWSLSKLEPSTESVVPQFARIYGQADTTDRHWIGELLLNIDPTGKSILPAMEANWDSYSEEARRSAQRLMDRFPKREGSDLHRNNEARKGEGGNSVRHNHC